MKVDANFTKDQLELITIGLMRLKEERTKGHNALIEGNEVIDYQITKDELHKIEFLHMYFKELINHEN